MHIQMRAEMSEHEQSMATSLSAPGAIAQCTESTCICDMLSVQQCVLMGHEGHELLDKLTANCLCGRQQEYGHLTCRNMNGEQLSLTHLPEDPPVSGLETVHIQQGDFRRGLVPVQVNLFLLPDDLYLLDAFTDRAIVAN